MVARSHLLRNPYLLASSAVAYDTGDRMIALLFNDRHRLHRLYFTSDSALIPRRCKHSSRIDVVSRSICPGLQSLQKVLCAFGKKIKDAGRNIDFLVETLSHAASTRRWVRLRFHGEHRSNRVPCCLQSVSHREGTEQIILLDISIPSFTCDWPGKRLMTSR